MSAALSQPEQAMRVAAEANRLHAAGALSEAIATMRQAVLLYAASAPSMAAGKRALSATSLHRARADACRQCGDYLTEAGEIPEAATIYQEAVDLYGLIDGYEAERYARECARKIVAGMAALRAHPEERLYLRIAHYERLQRQHALKPGTEAEQAHYCAQIAQIFQRRDKPEESAARYREALALYARVPASESDGLLRAECHHRLASLLYYAFEALPEAAAHYQAAIALYADYEEPTEGGQISRSLCAHLLNEIEVRLRSEGASAL